jgi:hypothetical protein
MKTKSLLLTILIATTLSCEKKENHLPVIRSITTDPVTVEGSMGDEYILDQGQEITITCNATDEDNDNLTYTWTSNKGTFPNGSTGNSVKWTTPVFETQTSDNSMQSVTVIVTVGDGKDKVEDVYAVLVYKCCYKGALPVISELPVISDIASSSVTVTCNIESDNNNEITARGVCYNTTGDPTINDNVKTSGTGTEPFSVTLTNLLSNTEYYLRAYAKNSSGIAYSNESSFKTTSLGSYSFTLGGTKYSGNETSSCQKVVYGEKYFVPTCKFKNKVEIVDDTYGIIIYNIPASGSVSLTPGSDADFCNGAVTFAITNVANVFDSYYNLNGTLTRVSNNSITINAQIKSVENVEKSFEAKISWSCSN